MSAKDAAELKAQGVEEAARDPHSKVTAADAERVLAQESRKAGVPAFTFDPNASPEQKAAAARAARPPGFSRPEKRTGLGVVTDQTTGPDQYDLPTPTAAGAVSPPDEAKTNGHAPAPQSKNVYEEKTGWAPRFGLDKLTGAEANESLLDHQTWLDSKLDDKFFGDWYHNTAVIIFACLSSWIVAVLGGGLAWVFLVMAACGTYYRTSIRRVRRNFRDDVHREMAKARLETDVETLEWINSFLLKFWPIYAPVLCETIINSVDQVLSTSTPAFLDSMRMKVFTLGTKPPRLEHVKTYPKAEDDIVLMDWKFSFTPGDRMDLTSRQLKARVNPKVVLEVRVGKGVISKGLDVIVEDFAFSGLMRVRVKLQLPFPHVEKIEICFLERPDIDYVCKPLGGDTLGIDINFIPGLERFIKEQIHGNLGPIMYAPNVFPIEIAKMLAGNPVDQAIGVLAVTLHGAQGLKNPDKLAGTPDPYLLVSLNGRASLGKTKIVKQNANPRWNETIYVIVSSLTDTLTLQLFDFNEYRKDKDIGTASFALEQLEQIPEFENQQLEVLASGKARGIVQADIRFFPVLEPLKLEDGTEQPAPESNTGIARFTVEQAKDLDGSKSLVGQLSPYAVLLLNGKEIHQTQHLKRTNQPIWANGSKEFLVTDRKAARLGAVIKDERELAGDQIVGTYQIKLDDMLKMMDQGKEWFNLSSTSTGRVKMMLQWKPVALRGALVGGSGGYITPVGVMRLHFKSAHDLRNVETMGKSDPYVRVLLSGVEKGKTVTFENNLNPEWDEVIYVPVHSPRERLTLEVMDYQNVTRDRSLGLIELPVANYMHENENGEYVVNDEKHAMSEGLRMNGRGPVKGTLNFTAAFYPTIPTIDPEEEEAAKRDLEDMKRDGRPRSDTKSTSHTKTSSRGSVGDEKVASPTKDAVAAANDKNAQMGRVSTGLAKDLAKSEQENSEEPKEIERIRLTPDNVSQYGSGLAVFRLIKGDFARPNVRIEVVMDDMLFPSFVSSKARSTFHEFGETGDAMVREVDLSRITLRLVTKDGKKGEESEDHVIGKLSGEILPVLQRSLYQEREITLHGQHEEISRVTILMKYLPIKMQLDPSESMNNMGTLRVDVLDAADLPSADRNGYSDPYCKFDLNGEHIYKTKVQKKTLHPAWNEYFETPIASRTAASFKVRVMDWDFGDKADFLGGADIPLANLEPMQSKEVVLPLDGTKGPGTAGALRLRLLFKAAYVTRSRRGSSTFSGTIGPAGKIIGAPVKGVGKVGGGVIRGATLLKTGFRHRDPSSSGEGLGGLSPSSSTDADMALPSIETPIKSDEGMTNGQATPSTPGRSPSFSGRSLGGGTKGEPGSGTADLTVVSASGFKPGSKVQVSIRQLAGKAFKDVLKTKPIKATDGNATWEAGSETAHWSCTPDAQFQIVVRDHHTLFTGGSEPLGEALFFVDDSSEAGSEKTVPVGAGSVVVRSRFLANSDASSMRDSPRSAMRRSFLSKRDSRQSTPS